MPGEQQEEERNGREDRISNAQPLERDGWMVVLPCVGLNSKINSTLCSPCSAVIEHTNRVIYLEDNDVAAVGPDGCTSTSRSPFQFCPPLLSSVPLTEAEHPLILIPSCIIVYATDDSKV